MDVSTSSNENQRRFDSSSVLHLRTDTTWTRDSANYHKLDVLRSYQFNRIAKINLVVLSFCTAYVLMCVILTNTAFAVPNFKLKLPDGRVIKLKSFVVSRAWIGFEISIGLLCSVGMLCLTIVYPYRVIWNNKYKVSQEQIWVLVLVVTNALTMNPLIRIVQLQQFVLNPKNSWFTRFPGVRKTVTAIYLVRVLGSTITTLFYMWATATTYNPNHHMRRPKSFIRFYVPKVISLLMYFAVRAWSRVNLNVTGSMIPFATVLSMLMHTVRTRTWHRKQLLLVLTLTMFEFIFVWCIMRRVRITNQALSTSDYLKYRSKQIGFRFFLATMLVYFIAMILLDAVITFGVPKGWYIAWQTRPPFVYLYLNNLWGGYMYSYLNFPLQLITAYAFLPPDSHGFYGWFGPSSRTSRNGNNDPIEDRPLSLTTEEPKLKRYRRLHRRSGGSRQSFSQNSDRNAILVFDARPHANSLCLPTHIKLLNFAWLAYDWKKFEKEVFTWLDDADCRIYKHIQHSASDTELFIVSSKDRIIITFKGTDSMQNIWTDVNVVRSPLSNVLPTYASATHELCETLEWTRASVHRGFLEGYRNVAGQIVDCVEQLLEDGPRPILLTGHSLGGGLATICSLDLRICLGISETDLLVSTFGSPRVGNQFWSRLYDRFIPMHWRFTVQGDAVPWYPKLGYKHVGKRVLLTQTGNLFLDPNSLEGVLWQTEVPNPLYHKKECYLRCLTTFCSKFTELKPRFYGHELQDGDSVSQVLNTVRSFKTERGSVSSRAETRRSVSSKVYDTTNVRDYNS